MDAKIKLGINIDHIATLRNARGSAYPDIVKMAEICVENGADIITLHLREDRRHVRDGDLNDLLEMQGTPVNLEIAPTAEMLGIAASVMPHSVCLVPENRQELTTEGGLDFYSHHHAIANAVDFLKNAGIKTSLFVDPTERNVLEAKQLGADAVELHTGHYANAFLYDNNPETEKICFHELIKAAKAAKKIGLECHVGHGLEYQTVEKVILLPAVTELHIGYFVISQGLEDGIGNVVAKIRSAMDKIRN